MTNLLAPTNVFGKGRIDERVSQRFVAGDTVASRVKRIVDETGRSARQLSLAIGSSKSWIQTVIDGLSQNPEAERLRKLAEETGYSFDWLATGRGEPKASTASGADVATPRQPEGDPAAFDPKIGTFLMRLRRLPGFEAWVEEHSSDYSVSQIARVMAIYQGAPPSSRSDGQPVGGWDAYVSAALAGKLSMARPGAFAEVEAAELAQMSAEARKRLRPASKK